MGLTVPVNSLLGEACEPRLRGLLDTISSLIMAVGYNIASYMMQLQSFRNIALVCSIFPIITVIYTYFVSKLNFIYTVTGNNNFSLNKKNNSTSVESRVSTPPSPGFCEWLRRWEAYFKCAILRMFCRRFNTL